jgi:hypothetical protein
MASRTRHNPCQFWFPTHQTTFIDDRYDQAHHTGRAVSTYPALLVNHLPIVVELVGSVDAAGVYASYSHRACLQTDCISVW